MADAAEESTRKRQRSATLPVDLVKRATNAVYWCRMVPGEPASYSELTERGIRDQVDRLERLYNGGAPFEDGQLRPGPAPGVMQRVADMRRAQREAQAAEEAVSGDDPDAPAPKKGRKK